MVFLETPSQNEHLPAFLYSESVARVWDYKVQPDRLLSCVEWLERELEQIPESSTTSTTAGTRLHRAHDWTCLPSLLRQDRWCAYDSSTKKHPIQH